MLRRFRFPKEGSSTTSELFDAREITGESAARLRGINEVREPLEPLRAGPFEGGAADVRDLSGVLRADAAVSIYPQAERTRAHLGGYFSSSQPSLRPKPL